WSGPCGRLSPSRPAGCSRPDRRRRLPVSARFFCGSLPWVKTPRSVKNVSRWSFTAFRLFIELAAALRFSALTLFVFLADLLKTGFHRIGSFDLHHLGPGHDPGEFLAGLFPRLLKIVELIQGFVPQLDNWSLCRPECLEKGGAHIGLYPPFTPSYLSL